MNVGGGQYSVPESVVSLFLTDQGSVPCCCVYVAPKLIPLDQVRALVRLVPGLLSRRKFRAFGPLLNIRSTLDT
jgi:hypothetical protein